MRKQSDAWQRPPSRRRSRPVPPRWTVKSRTLERCETTPHAIIFLLLFPGATFTSLNTLDLFLFFGVIVSFLFPTSQLLSGAVAAGVSVILRRQGREESLEKFLFAFGAPCRLAGLLVHVTAGVDHRKSGSPRR